MNSADLLKVKQSIQKKLLGKHLKYEEIFLIIKAIAEKKLDDILLTYFAAASYNESYSLKELYYLTKAMVETGIRFNFSPPVADKHSTGGLPGNRVTLVLVPIIASLGIKIPKTSSRAITSPAGTADCMEVLAPVELSKEKIEKVVKETNGCIIWGGHLNIAPADDELIRVEKPLQFEPVDKIIVSIMAKKVAMSSTHLVLDIPYAKSLKIKTRREAQEIAEKFKKLGKLFNIKIKAIISQVDEPAGKGIGPVLETIDALKVLEQQKDKPPKLEEKSLIFATELTKLALELTFPQAKEKVTKVLTSGQALEKLKQIIKAQGGDPSVDSNTLDKRIQEKSKKRVLTSQISGKIKRVVLANLNSVAKILGAPGFKWAGVKILKSPGQKVEKHEPILELFGKDKKSLEEAVETLKVFPIYEIK